VSTRSFSLTKYWLCVAGPTLVVPAAKQIRSNATLPTTNPMQCHFAHDKS